MLFKIYHAALIKRQKKEQQAKRLLLGLYVFIGGVGITFRNKTQSKMLA